MPEFTIGDTVRFTMWPDGATFQGVLQDFTAEYVVVNGCGFPVEDIVTAEHA